MKQKILIMGTPEANMRSSAESWGGEDGNLVKMDKVIGFTPSIFMSCGETTPDCPLRALGYGWRLIGPPVKEEYKNEDEDKLVSYIWYF